MLTFVGCDDVLRKPLVCAKEWYLLQRSGYVMKRKTSILGLIAAAIAGLTLGGAQAKAASVLTLDDGNILDFKTVTDGGALDTDGLVNGVISYNGAVGTNWKVNVATGLLSPSSA